jgi:hypothetical protein
MKTLAVILLFATTIYSTSNKPSDFEGTWHSPEMDNMKITVYQSSDNLWYGKIVESDNKDDVGKLMLRKMSYNERDNSLNGEAQKPDNFFVANVKLHLKSKNELRLTVSKFMMSRSYILGRE